MKHVLTLLIIFISTKMSPYPIKNIQSDSFIHILPTIEVTYNYSKYKKIKVLKSKISEINTLGLKDSCNIELIYSYFPKFNKKLSNNRCIKYTSVVEMYPVWEYLLLKYNIPKFISISFWIEETRWGQSELFSKYYNLGGIKCWNCNNSYRAKDDCGDKLCKFQKFNSLQEGVDFWAKVLTKNRYMKHVIRDDYEHYVKAYKKGGYWTSPHGVNNRINHIKKLKLDKL